MILGSLDNAKKIIASRPGEPAPVAPVVLAGMAIASDGLQLSSDVRGSAGPTTLPSTPGTLPSYPGTTPSYPTLPTNPGFNSGPRPFPQPPYSTVPPTPGSPPPLTNPRPRPPINFPTPRPPITDPRPRPPINFPTPRPPITNPPHNRHPHYPHPQRPKWPPRPPMFPPGSRPGGPLPPPIGVYPPSYPPMYPPPFPPPFYPPGSRPGGLLPPPMYPPPPPPMVVYPPPPIYPPPYPPPYPAPFPPNPGPWSPAPAPYPVPPPAPWPIAPVYPPAPPYQPYPPSPAPCPPPIVVPPASHTGKSYWSVVGDPVIKTLGGRAETLNNMAGRFVLMESRDGRYMVTHEVTQEPGTAAKRSDHRDGAFTQAVAVRQDGNTVVFRNQQSKAVLGLVVNQLEINGALVPLDELKLRGTLVLPNGGEVRWTEPSAKIKEGIIRIISSQGDVLRIEDKGPYIDLYGTPAANRLPGELAGLAGSNDAAGPGFYLRLQHAGGQAGWDRIQKTKPDTDHDHHTDEALVESWRATGAEDPLGWVAPLPIAPPSPPSVGPASVTPSALRPWEVDLF